jgi:hypothetical protein
MMQLNLVPLPNNLRGIYGATKDKLGAQQLFAHPDLEAAINRLERDGVKLIFSDIFRSAQGSRDARRKKGGIVQPAGYSAHNYGLAVDLDIGAIMKELRITKKQLDELLENYGLYCHRTDHALGSEAWHYNCLGPSPEQWLKEGERTTANAVERKIQGLYGESFRMEPGEILDALAKLKILSVVEFQRAWDLVADGIAGPKTQRTLALVSAERG